MYLSKTTPSPSVRRQSIRSQLDSPKTVSSLPCISPSLSSVSSFSNMRRPSRPRSNSINSVSSNTSNSSCTSISTTSSTIKRRYFSPSSDISNDKLYKRYTGTIKVTIRIKPISEVIPQWTAVENNKISHPDHGDFRFDRVFGPQCNNFTVFRNIGSELVDRLLEGFNATLFAYGMTGSGKTYTMLGEGNNNMGIVELCGSYLFDKFEEFDDSNNKFDVMVSYLEIYNEKIHDLLDTSKKNEDLKLRSDTKSNGGIHVIGLTERRCQNSDELMRWVKMGELSRKTGKTDYNVRSSRSHAIIQIKLTTIDCHTGHISSNVLSLCDLAGSERATAQLERRKEGSYINKSLLALGTVIAKLSAESNIKETSSMHSSSSSSLMGHIPYRDSKLTRLLQPALSGDSIVTTICTIDPRKDASTETINTLRFGSRAKNISLSISRKPINTGLVHNNGNIGDLEKDRKIRELSNLIKEQENIIRDLKIQTQDEPLNKMHNDDLSIPMTYLNLNHSTDDPNIQYLTIENKILMDKVNNFEKLLDKDGLELKDSQIVEIVDMLPFEVGNLLETKVQGFESEIRQYKTYIDSLEKKLMVFQQNEEKSRGYSNVHQNLDSTVLEDDLNVIKLGETLQRKENKIIELQKMLERKDKMIDALQSAKRLRDTVLKPMSNLADTGIDL